MRTKFKFQFIVLFLLIFNVSSAIAGWTVHSSTDEMEGTTNCFASSQSVNPTKPMKFPYNDVNAWLGIGNNGKSEWAYIGFSKEPNIIDKKPDNGYSVIKTRMKWDDQIEIVTLTQDWGSKFLHFALDSRMISKIAKHKKVMLELNWYGQGQKYFVFPLTGSSDAIARMRRCGAKNR